MTNYKIIQTEDGSKTLYSKLYDENCHSTSGAVSETILHYIEGCKINETSKKHSPLKILEVGFGAGIGFLETVKALNQTPFEFISFEIDEELIHIFEKTYNIKFTQNENTFLYKNFLRF